MLEYLYKVTRWQQYEERWKQKLHSIKLRQHENGVLSNGAFASTFPHTAANGLPCKDILAIFREGYCEINILAHFHKIYHARDFYLADLEDENFNLYLII